MSHLFEETILEDRFDEPILTPEPSPEDVDGSCSDPLMCDFLDLCAAMEGYTKLFESGFAKFVQLPREIRNMIYEF